MVFLLQVLIPIFNCKCKDLQGGGVPFVDLFLQFFKSFNKEISFFKQGKVFDLVKVCFVFAFEKHACCNHN